MCSVGYDGYGDLVRSVGMSWDERMSGQVATNGHLPFDPNDQSTWPTVEEVSLVAAVRALEARQASIETRIAEFADMIQPYLTQLTPLIDQLANSPLFRAMTGGKRKS